MKYSPTIFVIGLLLGNQRGNCQSAFQNLDFESANIPDVPTNQIGSGVPVDQGMPGWSVYLNGFQMSQIGHNNFSAGGAFVAIEGPQWNSSQILEGSYTAYITGSYFGTPSSASIAQTGQIPVGSESVMFDASPFADFQVTFGGHLIPIVQLGTGPNYDIMGGDISAFAGQTDELRFTELSNVGAGLLDNIQFSVSPVPEPGTLALFAAGALLLAFRRRR